MKKDGTKYLINYVLNIDRPIIEDGCDVGVNRVSLNRWEIVEWGEFSTITPKTEGWRTQNGLGLKIDKILKYIELEELLRIISLDKILNWTKDYDEKYIPFYYR